jgi:hypothetical protein
MRTIQLKVMKWMRQSMFARVRTAKVLQSNPVNSSEVDAKYSWPLCETSALDRSTEIDNDRAADDSDNSTFASRPRRRPAASGVDHGPSAGILAAGDEYFGGAERISEDVECRTR